MGEEWEEEIKADRVGRCAGGRRRRVGIGRWWRGDGESQTGGGGGGQADLINEEMSDEQRQRGEASTSMRSTNNTDIQNIKKKTKNISGTVKQTHQLSHTHTHTHINTHTHRYGGNNTLIAASSPRLSPSESPVSQLFSTSLQTC